MTTLMHPLDRWAETWWSYVLHASWQAAVLGLVLLVVLRLGRRWPSPLRYGILLIALTKFACPPWLPAPTGLFSRVGPILVEVPAQPSDEDFFAGEALAVRFDDGGLSPEPPWTTGASIPGVETHPAGEVPVAAATGESHVATRTPGAPARSARSGHGLPAGATAAASHGIGNFASSWRPGWKAGLMLVHALGALVLLSWTACQMLLLSRRVRQAAEPGPLPLARFQRLCRELRMPRGARLLVASNVASPVAFGILRPTVLLPSSLAATLSEPDLDTVLAHELIHLRRGDAWINWAQHLVCIAWWFHPVAWLVSRSLRKLREDCCDDLLLARGMATPEAYCQTLLRVATAVASRPRLRMTMEMARGLHPIGRRLVRIMDNAVRRTPRLSAATLGLLVVLAALTLPGMDRSNSAAAPRDKPTPKPSADKRPATDKGVQPTEPVKVGGKENGNRADPPAETAADFGGTVYDPQGKPAGQVTVWLLGGSYDEPPQVLAETISEADGRFTFPGVSRDEAFAPRVRQPQVLGRDAQQRIGWSNRAGRNVGPPYNVELREVAETRGRLLDTAGQPIAAARIKPRHLKAGSGRERNFNTVELPLQLASELEAATAEDGSFSIPGMPREGGLIAGVEAKGHARPNVIWDTGTHATIRLDRAGSISGSLVLPDDIEQPPPMELVIRMQLDPVEFNAADVAMNFYEILATTKDGTFRVDGLPAGRYDIRPQPDYSTNLYARPIAPVDVQAGAEVSGISIPVLRSIEVAGQVLDEDGQPIAGVEIWVCNITEQDSLIQRLSVTTDADGRYSGYAEPGIVAARVQKVPDNFIPPGDGERLFRASASADAELPPIRLERALSLPVEVVDNAGQPVADAEVHLVRPPSIHNRGNLARTNAEGKVTLIQVDPADTLPLRARTSTAVTNGAVVVVPADVEGAARLVVSDRSAFRLRGRLVDAAGNPIGKAPIVLWWNRNYVSGRTGLSGVGSVLDSLVSNADGTFESKALWPGDRYNITVDAEGYAQFESAQLLGKPGETHDFSDIVLEHTGHFVEGKVLHNGAPLAGVHVFNSGDASQPLHTTTDEQGRFRLAGFFPGDVYVFAEHDGYRFAGLRVPTDTSDATLELMRKDHKPPMQGEASQAGSFEAERRVARQWLERLWPINQQDPNRRLWENWSLSRLLVSMARLDPATALAWSKQAGGWHPDRVRPIAAESVAGDPDEVLAVLGDARPQVASRALLDLAQRVSADEPATALRYVQEAMVRARAHDQPYRAYSMANAAALAIRLGQDEPGRAALAEAAGMAAKLGSDDHQGYARGIVAAALAPYDLQQALALVEPIEKPGDRERYLGNIAAAIGAQEPDKALDVVRDFPKGGSELNRVKMRIAYALARVRPAEAVAIVEGIEGRGSAKTKAEAFGWLAVGVKPSDPQLAWSLIDRSLEIHRNQQEEFSGWSNYGGPSTFAAHVACQAHQVGYPDMQAVVYQVMAARPTVGLKSQVDLLECWVTTARLLALVDRRTARELLERVEPRRDLVGSGGVGSIDRGEWLQAWALVDLERAVQLFDEELPAALKETTDGRLRQLMSMVELLTIPSFDRPAYMYPSGAIWFPSQEP
ncbi:MAG: M56 family metallopeptidase [Pirellulales bacterium]